MPALTIGFLKALESLDNILRHIESNVCNIGKEGGKNWGFFSFFFS